MRPTPLLFLLLLAIALGPACERKGNGANELHVFAASPLRDIMSDFEERFEAAHGGVDVKLVLADSETLQRQIEQGARPDVFVTDKPNRAQRMVDSGLIGPQHVFAEDELALVIPATNPADIEQFDQLGQANVILLAAPRPGGPRPVDVIRAARAANGEAFARKIQDAISADAEDVRRVRAALESGNADAAIMQRTDAVASPRLRVIAIPEGMNEQIRFSHAMVEGGPNPRMARRWLQMIESNEGRTTLERWGYAPP